MKKIAITGLSGVIGNLLAERMESKFEIIDLYHTKKYQGDEGMAHQKIDLVDIGTVTTTLEKQMPDAIIHLASVTHIDTCEKDKLKGKDGIVWKTNVEGTNEIAKFSAKHTIPFIFTSTECVFDGKKEYYTETDKTNPINWYGMTKQAAEESILNSQAPATIIRSVVAYHPNDAKKTIYGKLLHDLKQKDQVAVVADQLFTPTYTYDIVKAIILSLEEQITGILHVAPQSKLSPFAFAKLVAKKNNITPSKLHEITLESLYGPERAALRLRNACLDGLKSNELLAFTPQTPETVIVSA